MEKNTQFWLNDVCVLFKHENLTQVFPYDNLSNNEKLNAMTRFVIYVSLLGYMLMNNYIILLVGIVLILGLLYIYMFQKNSEGLKMRKKLNMHKIGTEEHPENLQESVRNPFSNVLMTDYEDNPEKEEYDATYDESEEKRINDRVKQFIMENNKDNKDIGKIFNNLGDNFDFENSLRQFNANPITTIPNNQNEFLKYCYKNLYSEKPLMIF